MPRTIFYTEKIIYICIYIIYYTYIYELLYIIIYIIINYIIYIIEFTDKFLDSFYLTTIKRCINMNPILFLQLYYYVIWFVQLYCNLMLISFEDKKTCAIWILVFIFMMSINILAFQSQFTIKFIQFIILATPVFACRRQ